MIEFQKYPKTPRLFRDCVVTEKIDGTNAAVQVVLASELLPESYAYATPSGAAGWVAEQFPQYTHVTVDNVYYAVAAQSRNRMITPSNDNAGFSRWVHENAELLAKTLGPGIHFGEWWGQGIQRRYGMDRKVFSLFNVNRWAHLKDQSPSDQLSVVPTVWEGPFDTNAVRLALLALEEDGSMAAPGFMNPEGIVVFHKASGQVFKVTVENDEEPKGLVK